MRNISCGSLRDRVLVLLMAELVFGALLMFSVWLFQAGVGLAALAWCVCLVSVLLAHVLSEYPAGDEFLLLRVVVGGLSRTFLPLVVSVWAIYFAVPPLEKKLVLFMMLCYVFGLLVDSSLSLARLKHQSEIG